MNEFNKNWLKLALEYKDNSDVTFNLSQNDIRILLTYIEILQSKIDKAIEYIERVQKSENDINPYILHAPTLLTILKGDDK